jgi:hypothetical protein
MGDLPDISPPPFEMVLFSTYFSLNIVLSISLYNDEIILAVYFL